jgi:hypothetical protein
MIVSFRSKIKRQCILTKSVSSREVMKFKRGYDYPLSLTAFRKNAVLKRLSVGNLMDVSGMFGIPILSSVVHEVIGFC